MNYFCDIPLFLDMSEQDQKNLSDFCQLQHVNAGQNLFLQGDDAQALYIIKSWTLWVYRQEWEEKKSIATLGFGDIVWEMSFFWQPPVRNASVTAQSDVEAITLLHYSLSQILEKYPNIHTHLQQIIQDRIQKNTGEIKK